MGKPPPEFYWEKHNHKYRFQISVDHMSEQDIDPRRVQKEVSFHFLRVPFGGKAYWGFLTEADLNDFKVLAKIPQK